MRTIKRHRSHHARALACSNVRFYLVLEDVLVQAGSVQHDTKLPPCTNTVKVQIVEPGLTALELTKQTSNKSV